MWRVRDVYLSRFFLSKQWINPQQLDLLIPVINGGQSYLGSTLSHRKFISEAQWKMALQELSSIPNWPDSPAKWEEDNLYLLKALQQKQVLSASLLEQAWNKGRELFSQGYSYRIDEILVYLQYINADQLYPHLPTQFQITLQCPGCQRTLVMERHYPWHVLPCPCCGQPMSVANKQNQIEPSLDEISTVTMIPYDPSEKERRSAEKGNSISIGSTFGQYKILKKLGQGGMGAVYKALDIKLNRTVALKVMLHLVSAAEHEVKRFYQEAQLVANLKHPYIATLHEMGEVDGTPYFTMDYIEGINLREKVNLHGVMEEEEALGIVNNIVKAVCYAHELGVIHRDIKPENIMLDHQGHPYLMDFGLAKNLDSENTQLTRTGAVMGSPEFMSPEQATGEKDMGYSVDIYCIGGVLFYLLAGRPPFQGSDLVSLLMQVIQDTPPLLRSFNNNIDRPVEIIVQKCLEKEVGYRYESMANLQWDIQAVIEGDPIKAQAPGIWQRAKQYRKKYRRRIAFVSFCLVFTFAIVFIGRFWDSQQIQKQKKQEQLKQITKEIERVRLIMSELKNSNTNKFVANEKIVQLVQLKKSKHVFRTIFSYWKSFYFWQHFAVIQSLGKMGNSKLEIRGQKIVSVFLGRLREIEGKEHLIEIRELIWALGRLGKGSGHQEIEDVVLIARMKNRVGSSLWKDTEEPYRWLPRSKRDGAYYYKQGLGQWEKSNFNTALAYFQISIQRNPLFIQSYYYHGRALHKLARYREAILSYKTYLSVNHNHSQANFYLGEANFYSRKFVPAKKAFRRALQGMDLTKKNRSWAHLYLGRLHVRKRQYSSGIREYNKAIQTNKSFARAYTYRGIANYRFKRISIAIRDLKQSWALNKSYWETAKYLSRLYIIQKKYSQSLKYLKQMIPSKDRKVQRDYYYEKAHVYFLMKDYSSAKKWIEKSLEITSNLYAANFYRGKIHQAMGKREQAILDFTRAVDISVRPTTAYVLRGQLYYEIGKFALALADLDFTIRHRKEEGEAYYWRGMVYLKLGKKEMAYADFNKALKVKKKYPLAAKALRDLTNNNQVNFPLRWKVKRQIQRAKAQKNWKVVIIYCQKYIKMAPNEAFGYFEMCRAYIIWRNMGWKIKAENCLDLAVKNCPPNDQVFLHCGKNFLRLGNSKRAIYELSRAIKFNGKSSKAYYFRAQALLIRQDIYLALKDSSRAIKISSNEHIYYLLRGKIYYQLKQYELALKDYNFSLKLKFSNECLFQRGHLYFTQGKYKLALNDFLLLLKSTPGKFPMVYLKCGHIYRSQKKHLVAVNYYKKYLEFLPFTKQETREVKEIKIYLKKHLPSEQNRK